MKEKKSIVTVFSFLFIAVFNFTCSVEYAQSKVTGASKPQVYNANTVTLPYPAGLHNWPIFGGKLILVAGRYTNQTDWDVRTYNFYMQIQSDFYQVPIEDQNNLDPFEWLQTHSWSQAEYLVSDILIVSLKDKIYLLKASQATSKGVYDKGDISIKTYMLEKTEEDIPYVFNLKHARIIKDAPRTNIDLVLLSEANKLK